VKKVNDSLDGFKFVYEEIETKKLKRAGKTILLVSSWTRKHFNTDSSNDIKAVLGISNRGKTVDETD